MRRLAALASMRTKKAAAGLRKRRVDLTELVGAGLLVAGASRVDIGLALALAGVLVVLWGYFGGAEGDDDGGTAEHRPAD